MSELAPGRNRTHEIIRGLLIGEIHRLERLQTQWNWSARAHEIEHVKAALAQIDPVPLDQPDAPGYWAFEGKIMTQLGLSVELTWVVEVSFNSIDKNLYVHSTTGHIAPVKTMLGKWTRVFVPWED